MFNTCAVRENAADRLYGNLGHLLPAKKAHKGMQIAVGGCLAQMERQKITDRAPWVDVVYGTHNIGALPKLLERAREREQAQVEFEETLTTFPSLLPARRQSAYSAWVSISVGCNNTCTFCIVPSLRGKEKDRRPGDILDEVKALVADGVIEVTLLGQNVNSYGAEFGDKLAFGKLLRACGEIDGLERVRFTSPHPRDFTDDVIEAMRDTPNVMPSLHMPLQSGSDTVLKAMRRAYRRDRYLAILDNVRRHIPHAAITTDIIVGFPGETEEDFAQTLDLVGQARFCLRVHLPVLDPRGHPGRDHAGPGAADGRAGALRPARRARRADRGRGERQAGRHRRRGPRRRGGGPQGRRHAPAVRPRPGQPPRPLRARGTPAPRPGDVVTTRVTRGAPHYLRRRRRAAQRAPHPGGRRLGGPPARRRGRDGRAARAAPRHQRRRSCSACRPPGLRTAAMLIAVVGPTAAGKSDLAVELALALNGEVINADSMQLYRGMDIGTAKLTAEERRGVPHHLLDVWDVTTTASVAEYQELADAVIADIEARGKVPVLVGGSGLYIRAALGDLEFPGTDEEIRERLEAELAAAGPAPLYARLRDADPVAAQAILPTNGRRIVRALEVIELSGRPFSATMPGYDAGRPAVQIGVQVDRPELDRRIDARVDRMWAAGFEYEVRAPGRARPA